MKTVGVIANCTKPRAADVLRRVREKADDLGMSLECDAPSAELLGVPGCPTERLFDKVDALMALGGDGTMLRAVRELAGRDIPIIGVNIGSLGFLTSVAEEDIDRAMTCLDRDDFTIAEWSLADSRLYRNGAVTAEHRALNDVVVATGSSTRVLTLDVHIDEEYVTSYVCDGLIVSTPAGSTGHSLSAGGPIVMPQSRSLVLSLICPHTLTSRPLVIPDSSVISVTAAQGCERALLAVDGQLSTPLDPGDRIEVTRSETGARFIHLPRHSYFGVLRQKLRWGGSSVR